MVYDCVDICLLKNNKSENLSLLNIFLFLFIKFCK